MNVDEEYLNQYAKEFANSGKIPSGLSNEEKGKLFDLFKSDGHSNTKAGEMVKEYDGIMREIQERAFNHRGQSYKHYDGNPVDMRGVTVIKVFEDAPDTNKNNNPPLSFGEKTQMVLFSSFLVLLFACTLVFVIFPMFERITP